VLKHDMVTSPGALGPLVAQWDELAKATGRPYCAPAWSLAWWRHAAPPGAGLRVITAREDGRLIGVAPLYTVREGRRHCYLPLCTGLSPRVEPLAAPGRQHEVAAAICTALSEACPTPDLVGFNGVPMTSPWPQLLTRGWPRRSPWVHEDVSRPAPIVNLRGTFEQWLNARSRNFRQQMRRSRRQLEREGVQFVMVSSDAELIDGLRSFAALHYGRWHDRGGSGVLHPGVEAMLVDAGRALLPEGRFRLWLARHEGRAISAHIFVAAGGEVSYWLGGFDEAWAAQHPSLLVILEALEHCFSSGDGRLDLNSGGQGYKYRFADSEDTLIWRTMLPRGRRYLRTRAATAPTRVARAAYDRLPDNTRRLVKATLSGRRSSD
jgi:CelD/BcsL family acetyltransferase involved in cellulose biosynthesis